ncbi:MAG: hypothetical protein ACJAQR_001958 [Bacteroidia bacterium]|jgi:hypothetical protein
MNKTYNIYLDEQLIGTTLLGKSDAPMGVAYGKMVVSEETFGYQFLKDYCASNEIGLACDFPEDNLIATATIKNLIVKDENGVVIPADGNQITGMDATGFEISLDAIPCPFYGEEFPHHRKSYDEMFKG